MRCPPDWFFFMEWQLGHPEEYQGVSSMLAFRDGLTADRREAVRSFLVAASIAEDRDLVELTCPDAHNAIFLQPREGHALREMFEVYLRDFDTKTSEPELGTS